MFFKKYIKTVTKQIQTNHKDTKMKYFRVFNFRLNPTDVRTYRSYKVSTEKKLIYKGLN